MGHRDFRIFGPLKEHPSGELFVTDVYVKQAVYHLLVTPDTDFFNAMIQTLAPW
jgi:hypothetical protein